MRKKPICPLCICPAASLSLSLSLSPSLSLYLYVSLYLSRLFYLSISISLAHRSLTRGPFSSVNCFGPPEILSYHVHIVFMTTSSDQLKKAIALRDLARQEFKDLLGPDCPDRFDDGRLCLIFDHPIDQVLADGPFPVGEWSMFVPLPYYSRVVPWFVQHRGEFSFLVHPNSGCEYEDHSIWAMWAGQPWQLGM